MKAPDKIYVASYNGEAFSHNWTMEPLGDTTATEYIRKDALLEWTKAEKEECSIGLSEYDMGMENGKMEILNGLINKLNSM